MGFLDKVKQAAKEAWQENQQGEALERDRDGVEDEVADIQRRGERYVFPSSEKVRFVLLQGGGGDIEGDFMGKLLSAAQEAANPELELDISGEGEAQKWPKGSNRLVVLTDDRLLVMQRREVLKEEPCLSGPRRWWFR